MGAKQSREAKQAQQNQKKIADEKEKTRSILRESASNGLATDICCMRNPQNSRLMCCTGISDMCTCCTDCWNGKLLSCCEFDCSIPTCCKCMWCEECCGDYKDDDLESEPLVGKKKDSGSEGASKDDDNEELWSGRRNRRLTTYYKDNYYSGQTKF